MTRLMNDLELPEPIFCAIQNRAYSKEGADFSVTELIAPAFQRALQERYSDEIVEEASDLIFSLLGTSVHSILEKAEIGNEHKYRREERYFATLDGSTISGGIDLIDSEASCLHDFKVCSRWVGVFGVKEEWVKQVNMYRWLAAKNGVEINHLKIHAIFRDWEKTKALRKERDYPQKQVKTFDIEVWPLEKTEAYVAERLHEHKRVRDLVNQSLSDDQLLHHVCSREERWEQNPSFAVMKRGRKSALRLLPTLHEASEWILENGNGNSGMFIEERPAESKRCAMYCSVKPFCPFGKRINEPVS